MFVRGATSLFGTGQCPRVEVRGMSRARPGARPGLDPGIPGVLRGRPWRWWCTPRGSGSRRSCDLLVRNDGVFYTTRSPFVTPDERSEIRGLP